MPQAAQSICTTREISPLRARRKAFCQDLHTAPNSPNTTGSGNTAIGERAMKLGGDGSENTATGYFALYNDSASYNTTLGRSALRHNTTGRRNVAVGQSQVKPDYWQ